MGRPERLIPPDDHSPVAEFARELRRLRMAAGNPTYAQLEKRTGYSDTTLSAAMSGRSRPSPGVLGALVEALGGDVAEWEERRSVLPAVPAATSSATTSESSGPRLSVGVPSDDLLSRDEPGPRAAGAPAEERPTAAVRLTAPVRRWRAIAVIIIGVLVAATAVLAAGRGSRVEDRVPALTVSVQNLVTTGPSGMREDSPAYLSTRPENNCRARGCAVPGRSLGTGDEVDVFCQLTGERTTNGNDGDPSDDGNPLLVTTTRWYGSRLPDGRTGYLSEAWLRPADRGGLGLPPCPDR